MSAIIILFVLFWAIFFIFQTKNTLLIAFTAGLLFIFNQIGIAALNDINLFWVYGLLSALSLLNLLREKE